MKMRINKKLLITVIVVKLITLKDLTSDFKETSIVVFF